MRDYLYNLLLLLISSLTISILTGYINIITIYYEMSTESPIRHKFEYIIVGTGTAGGILMAGIPSNDVLILEAGVMHSSMLFDIPILTPILHKSAFDWDYLTIPQEKYRSCLSLKDKQSHWTRGKVFGGSHMLNNLIHFRGFKEDFRGWFGTAHEYNYENEILPHFRESEKYLNVGPATFKTKISGAFIKAGESLLSKSTFLYPDLNQNNGSRWTASHYNYNKPRNGHQLILNARVTKILFDKTYQTRAKGVEYISNGQVFQVYATKGIILSAGVIETPKLLMLSGVGPKNDLGNLSIPIIKDLPGVGKNLQDHVTTGMDLILLNQTLEVYPSNLFSLKNIYDYFNGKGPITFSGCDAMGFVNTKPLLQKVPDLSFMLLPVGISNDLSITNHLSKIINLDKYYWDNYFKPLINKNVISILPILLHPKSYGYVKLRDNNPLTSPIINPNYFKNENDIKILIKGLHIIEHLINQKSMLKFGAEINPKHYPGCENYKFSTDEYYECYIRHLTLTMYHPVGTCKMGDENDDEMSVVSKQFRVHGIENLYVVDASIMPNLPSGNPNAVISMLAQRFLSTLS